MDSEQELLHNLELYSRLGQVEGQSMILRKLVQVIEDECMLARYAHNDRIAVTPDGSLFLSVEFLTDLCSNYQKSYYKELCRLSDEANAHWGKQSNEEED